MPVGPGKYDELCTLVRTQSMARCAVVIVIGGAKGNGFSMQGEPALAGELPALLRQLAEQIEDYV